MEKFGTNQSQQLTNSSFNPDDMVQVKQLVDRLSAEDKNEIGAIMKKCAGEITLTRGVPLGLLIVGGMHLIRDKLPPNLQYGPRKWLFQGLIVSGCVTFSNLLFQNSCFDRIKPKLVEFHHKYEQSSGAASRYNALREANRHHQTPPSQYELNTPPPIYNQMYTQQQQNAQSESTESLPTESLESQKPQSRFVYEDPNQYYMSGTPTSRSSDPYDSRIPPPQSTIDHSSKTAGKGTYGDEGFS